MKAYQLVQWQKPPEFRDVPVPEPGPGQVLLKVAGAGACHSDLHLMEWAPGTLDVDLPFTLGHENAGWVEKVGAGVEGFRPGDPVLVYGPWGCGRCRACRVGMENYCENAATIRGMGGGLGRPGGMAPYLLVPSARWLVPIHGLDPRQAAPLSDAGLTPYHAVKRSLPLLAPGSTAVVIGAGGLGQMGIAFLRALSPARIVAIDTAPAKLAVARAVGADLALPPGDDAVKQIQDVTRGQGAEAVLDFVGAEATMKLGARVARKMGHLTVVGLAMGTFPFNFFALPYECAIAAPYWGSITELMEVVALAEAGTVKTRVELFPLEKAPDAYARLREGRIEGRAVITPNG